MKGRNALKIFAQETNAVSSTKMACPFADVTITALTKSTTDV